MVFNWREEAISKSHSKNEFNCGNNELNSFLQRYARQSHEKNTAKTYLAIDNESNKIIGFYTITLTSLSVEKLPQNYTRKFGYHPIPLFTLARLAVDKSVQGKGFGGQLLLKAAQRCMPVSEQVVGIGLLIDAKDTSVESWYQSFGAMPLLDQPLTLVLPFAQIKMLLQ